MERLRESPETLKLKNAPEILDNYLERAAEDSLVGPGGAGRGSGRGPAAVIKKRTAFGNAPKAVRFWGFSGNTPGRIGSLFLHDRKIWGSRQGFLRRRAKIGMSRAPVF